MKKSTAFERWNNYMREQNEKAGKDHEEKLLPCPFCGGKAQTCSHIVFENRGEDYQKHWNGYKYYVRCEICGIRTQDYHTNHEAYDAWNRRTQQKQPNEPLTLEELREMDGEPMWLHTFSTVQKKTNITQWAILEAVNSAYAVFVRAGCNVRLTKRFSNYGGTWFAYRSKPESEVSPVTNFDRVTAAPESLNQCDFCTNPMKNLAGPVVGCDGNCQFEDGVPQNITNSGPAAPSENWEAQVIRDLARQGVSYQDAQTALDIIRQLKQKEKKGENHGERI